MAGRTVVLPTGWLWRGLLAVRQRQRLIVIDFLGSPASSGYRFYFWLVETVLQIRTHLQIDVLKLPQHHGEVLPISVEHIALGLVVNLEFNFFEGLHGKKNTSLSPFQLYNLAESWSDALRWVKN